MANRILVTGAAGYIGSHLTPKLENVQTLKGLVQMVDAHQLEGVDTIVHLAGISSINECADHPNVCYAINAGGTRKLVDAANRAGVKRFILASSAAVYGGTSSYANSKRRAERELQRFGGIRVILRIFNVYGYESQSVKDKFETQDTLVVHGSGMQTRDFIHVDAVCNWIRLACSYEANIIEDVATGEATSILSLARSMNKPIIFDYTHPVGVKHSVGNVKASLHYNS